MVRPGSGNLDYLKSLKVLGGVDCNFHVAVVA